MPEPLDFDPINIYYNEECLPAEFIWNLIKIKGARPITKFYTHQRPMITTGKLKIEPLALIVEFLDTRFVQRRMLPIHPEERAAMQMLIDGIIRTPNAFTPSPFIMGETCTLADLAFATATHDENHLKRTLCALTSNK